MRLLDLVGQSPVCDYFVLATGTSSRQMRSVASHVQEYADEHDLRTLRGNSSSDRWIAVDLVDIVVHLFDGESREFYDLDNLWGDATEVQWKK